MDVKPGRRALCACAVVAMLSGCGGSPQALAPSESTAAHRVYQASSMDLEAKSQNLLYVSDIGANAVFAYSLPEGKRVGALVGFDQPQGLCVDLHGDVFVADDQARTVDEFPHGSKKQITALEDRGGYPVDCSFSLTTGNLAVTNVCSYPSCTQGGVAIYTGARGDPVVYTDPEIYRYLYCTYDDSGNLFVSGSDPSGAFAFAELPSRKKSFINITLKQTIGFSGGVKWDGAHVDVADQDTGVIYQFDISGKTGTEVGSVPLSGVNEIVDFWIQNKILYVPNGGEVGFYRYPSGGEPFKTLDGFTTPFGATVSLANKP